jgi:hypothetical protein
MKEHYPLYNMEPYIALTNTHFDDEKKQFTDKISYDGYDFSIIVSAKNIDKTASDLDYLFHVPAMTYGIPNIANMKNWEFKFYDDKERLCTVEKNNDYIYFMLPHYNIIRTDVSSGIVYLRNFYETVNRLMDEVYRPLNTAHIGMDY